MGLILDLDVSLILGQDAGLGLGDADILICDLVRRLVGELFGSRDRRTNLVNLQARGVMCVTNRPALCLLVFNAGEGFGRLLADRPRTVILTSGTLAPLASFAESLGAEFPIQAEGEHVAGPRQVFARIIQRGAKRAMRFTYQTRGDEAMRLDFQGAFTEVVKIVPKGVIAFFSSYQTMLENGAGVSAGSKPVFREDRDRDRSEQALAKYQQAATGDGALLLGVCRGKWAEGLDFSDDLGRCVNVIGIPFPPASDFHIVFRREWLEDRSLQSGDRWYNECALRAVNQSVGRIIRHLHDYGAILLWDERYAAFKEMLPRWLRGSIEVVRDIDALRTSLCAFFRVQNSSGFVAPHAGAPLRSVGNAFWPGDDGNAYPPRGVQIGSDLLPLHIGLPPQPAPAVPHVVAGTVARLTPASSQHTWQDAHATMAYGWNGGRRAG